MTEQELKEEAKKLGLTVTKKREYVKLAPCKKCGSKKIGRYLWSNHEQFYACKECNNCGPNTRYNYQARQAWNEANS